MGKAPTPGASAHAAPARAHGRSLSDFGELWEAEKTLLECCRRGEPAIIADKRPKAQTDGNRIRAGFVRFLALGGDETAPVHEQGVLVRGAWLTEKLLLDAARVEHVLALYDCRIDQICALQTSFKALYLNGSRLEQGLLGDGLRCDGSVVMRDKFHSSGTIRMLGARIGRDFDCSAGRFQKDKKGTIAICLDRAEIGHGILMSNGFHATGEVRLPSATVAAGVDCTGGRFQNPAKDALLMDGLTTSASVLLRDKFHAQGNVRLKGAAIGGDLICSGGRFENPEGQAMTCSHAKVTGVFLFHDVQVQGDVVLDSMHAGSLCDDLASWRQVRALGLDGFTYGQFVDGARTDARTRIAWLDSQWEHYLHEGFRPQPWEQVIAVLRAMGHANEARTVAIAKQNRLWRARKIVRGARTLHRLYGLTVGYGYRPLRLLISIGLVWLICAYFFAWGANPGGAGATRLIAPPDRQPSAACLMARAQARSDAPCPAPAPDYRTFVPLVYSADVLLPVVDFGYKGDWAPVVSDRDGNPLFWGRALRFLYWFEIAFGWVAGLLLVGMLGNLVKKD